MIETVVALGMIAFVTVGVLGLCPLGFRQAEAELLETHGVQMARELFATLRGTPFTAAECYGRSVDLSAVGEAGTVLRFYAPASGGADAVTTTVQDGSRYAITLTIRPAKDAPSAIEARRITMTLSPVHRAEPRASYEVVMIRSAGS